MALDLETLLQRIADGLATDAEVEEARALLEAFESESEPLGEALAAAFEPLDVTDAVMARLELELAPVGEAVRDEAGELDDPASVMAALELSLGYPVGEAVRAEAGAVDVSAAVMEAIGADAVAIGEAVRFEAGAVDVADAVMRAVASPAAMPAPVAAPTALQPANNSSRWLTGMLAAALVAVVIGGRALLGGPVDPLGAGLVGTDLKFASASEVEIEDLSFGDDVVVFQDEGDDGALILWIDEEVL